jgi:hypothetical protein
MLSAPRQSIDDPLACVFAPPPNESEDDKESRIRAEQEAKRRSDAIDEELNKQRITRKSPRPVKILLLGESAILLLRSPACLRSLTPSLPGQSESGPFRFRDAFSVVDSITMFPTVGKSTTLKSESAFIHL